MNDAVPLLRFEDVHKRYGDVEVLRGVDLDVAEGDVVCLIGASGCGKSTMLKCANLIEPIHGGRILLEGEEITDEGTDPDRVRRHIGIVFQAYNLFPHMNVLRNVTLAPRRVLGMPQEVAEEQARELLARFGLADKVEEYPDRLSGGQQQRAAIVRALAMQPRLMLLDEVTSALDPELVGEVLTVIRELAKSGMTMMIATHEMGFARQIADKVCFVYDGVILEQGPPETIFGSPKHQRTQGFLRRIVEAGRAADLEANA
jgi:polar amino acid transport system ATP-binding protein